jgi:hypothetical protein
MIAKSSGKIGDLLYGLPCAIAKGCKQICLFDGEWGDSQQIAKRLQPLLSDWIIRADESPHLNFHIDLDKFRQCPRLFQQHFTLSHCEMLDVPIDVLKEPWIKVELKTVHRIIVHRSFRTRTFYPYEFMCRMCGNDVGYVGTKEEYLDFCQQFPGCKAKWVEAPDLLQMAQVIAGAEFFMGNQSAGLALAEAMHHPHIRVEIGVPAQYEKPVWNLYS